MIVEEAIKQLLRLWGILTQRWKCRYLGSIDSVCDLHEDRTVIITGPTSGIGKAAAACLARSGAKVILACRNVARGEALVDELRSPRKENLEVWRLDVSDFDSIRDFLQKWRSSGRPVHVLINNAGIFDMAGPRSEVKNGFEQHLTTNFLGPFLLTLGLMPALRKGSEETGDSRVVNVTSSMQFGTRFNRHDPMLAKAHAYSSDLAYSQSKIALSAFTAELQRRIPKEQHITCYSVHPGAVITNVTRGLPALILWIYRHILKIVLLQPDEGARPVIYCGTNPHAPKLSTATYGYFDVNCKTQMPARDAQSREFGLWLWNWASLKTELEENMNLSIVS